MAEQVCGNCRYFEQGEVIRNSEDTYDGQCKRYPPVIVVGDDDSVFPAMDGTGWCGEYAPANPETAEEAATVLARFVLLGDLTAARALADKLRE